MKISLSGDAGAVMNASFQGTPSCLSILIQTDVEPEDEVVFGDSSMTLQFASESGVDKLTLSCETEAELEFITRNMFRRVTSGQVWIVMPHRSITGFN